MRGGDKERGITAIWWACWYRFLTRKSLDRDAAVQGNAAGTMGTHVKYGEEDEDRD